MSEVGDSAPVFGGMGGVMGGRGRDSDDDFEAALDRALGNAIRDDDAGSEVWSALANVDWYRPKDGATAGYSFRAAGDMIAAIRGEGDYMDWYCSGEYAQVSDRVARSMKKEGWLYDPTPSICDEPGCLSDATCGTPAEGGYRSTCGPHMPRDDA